MKIKIVGKSFVPTQSLQAKFNIYEPLLNDLKIALTPPNAPTTTTGLISFALKFLRAMTPSKSYAPCEILPPNYSHTSYLTSSRSY